MRFNKKYTVYLDVGNGYEEVFVADIGRFNYEREDGQYFWRYKWGEVTFSNNPKQSSELSDNEFKGYNLIADAGYVDPDTGEKTVNSYFQQIKIKYEDTERTIEGYFSHKDCKFQSGKHFKVIKVKPAILDQYTPLLENWEEEVGIIGGEVTANGYWRLRPINYNQFGNHTLPLALNSSNIPKAKDAAGDNATTNKFIYRATKGYILNVTVSAKAKNISGSGVYTIYLKKYDSDLNETSSSVITQRSIATDINETEFSGNGSINMSAGESIALTVDIGINSLDYTSINVSVSGNPINVTTKEVSVRFNTADMVNWRRWGIEDGYGARRIISYTEESGIPMPVDYFEDESTPNPGKPKKSYFGSLTYGFKGNSDGLYLYENDDQQQGLVDILGELDWELSEVTVFKGRSYVSNWFTGRREIYFHCICLFSREEVITKDIDGSPTDPPESPETYHIRESAPDGNAGYTLWTRKPYNGSYTEWTLGDPISSGGGYINNSYFDWQDKITSKRNYPTANTLESFSNAIDLYTLIKYMYNNTAYPSGDVKSTFLWNDYESDVPTISTGRNYVTMAENYFNNTVVLPTINLKENIDTTENNSKLELSFKDFMEDFRNFFKVVGQGNLYWFIQLNAITGEYDLRIEHIEFLDISSGIYNNVNLIEDTTYLKYLEETYNFSYDDSDMFRDIKIETVNSGYKGFKENNVSFAKIVTNTRNKDLSLEHQTKIISTDIQYAKENPNDLENGLIWLNIDENDNVIRDKTGSGDNNEMPNGYFATSNFLARRILRYECVWNKGSINGVSESSFENTLRNLMGEDFSIPNLHTAEFFNTGLGIGMTESLELDPERQITKLKLSYRRLENISDIDLKSGTTTNLAGFYLMVQKEGDFDGAANIYFDFGNYEN